ncbi:hypothetical protein [Hanamia caeni]|uniref:hypothetical protein n=1 Tax=Hanamia caeni TaxID=2294116 RepID=UPI0018F6EBCA|nr:hypothetical protein [Hanamia caeni]
MFTIGFFSIGLVFTAFLFEAIFLATGLAVFFAAGFFALLGFDACFFGVVFEFLSDFAGTTLAGFAFFCIAFFVAGFSFGFTDFAVAFFAGADFGAADFPALDFDATTVAFFLVAI